MVSLFLLCESLNQIIQRPNQVRRVCGVHKNLICKSEFLNFSLERYYIRFSVICSFFHENIVLPQSGILRLSCSSRYQPNRAGDERHDNDQAPDVLQNTHVSSFPDLAWEDQAWVTTIT